MILMTGVAFSIKMAAPKPVFFFSPHFPRDQMALLWNGFTMVYQNTAFVESIGLCWGGSEAWASTSIDNNARVMVAFISEIVSADPNMTKRQILWGDAMFETCWIRNRFSPASQHMIIAGSVSCPFIGCQCRLINVLKRLMVFLKVPKRSIGWMVLLLYVFLKSSGLSFTPCKTVLPGFTLLPSSSITSIPLRSLRLEVWVAICELISGDR